MRILWIDDDGPQRFPYECRLVNEDFGWELHWAASVQEGAMALASTDYDGLIVDLMLPVLKPERFGSTEEMLIWGGYWILAWLKGIPAMKWEAKEALLAASSPAESSDPAVPHRVQFELSALAGEALERNKRHLGQAGRVVVWTGFSGGSFYSHLSDVCPDIDIYNKPIVEAELVGWLESLRASP